VISADQWAEYARCFWRAALIYRTNGHLDVAGYPMWRKMVSVTEECTLLAMRHA
jgi:hypothetical protein